MMSRQSDFYGWKLLAVLWFVQFASVAFPLYGAGVINPYMAADFHFDRRTLGFAFGMFMWMAGLPGPLVALCVRKKGVRFTLVLGGLLVVTGALLMALFVRTPAQLAIVFGVLIGLGAVASGNVPALTGVSLWFVKRKALAISLLLTGIAVGGCVAPALVNHLIAAFGGNWRVGWWLIAGLGVCSTVAVALLVKERPSDLGQFPDGEDPAVAAATQSGCVPTQRNRTVFRTAEEWTFSEALRTSASWLILFGVVAYSAGYLMFIAHGVVHLKDLGHTPAEAAFSLSLMVFFLFIGKLLVGVLGDHIEPRLLWAAGLMSLGIGMSVALKASGGLALYSYAVLLGLGIGMSLACSMTMPANYFGGKTYSSFVGLIAAMGTTAGAIGAYAGGYVFDHFGSYAGAFYTVSIMCFAGSAIMLVLVRPPVRRAAPYVQTAAGQA